ncbi:hypothetical protein M2H12_21275 [Vibrio vulnificus]|uniref:hypothetical protein n=1 Tax=Vibrio vulnificus TaxID=672 RepID=UPI00102979FE|nr:hypothetical protein [Vibrio vulnificus]MCU8168223.1 hypothetical protein [Vibrio vulnificus]MCU8172776.1 hypothetical protein [Vibrio vulnificus]MCU8269171.1 hypothetical protein [Vibrio vulnificus]RZP95305.1 hypothetical protein D8T54_14105 [Vibrio vulnificus]RZR37299.1 hypothetical protein D8T58_24260 [Vibrio vulnificus]
MKIKVRRKKLTPQKSQFSKKVNFLTNMNEGCVVIFLYVFLLYSVFWFFSDDSPGPRYVSNRNYDYSYAKTIYFRAKISDAHKVKSSPEYGESQYKYVVSWHGWDPVYKRYNDINCTVITSKEKAYEVGDILAFLDYEEDDARDCRIPTQNPEKIYLYLKWWLSKFLG